MLSGCGRIWGNTSTSSRNASAADTRVVALEASPNGAIPLFGSWRRSLKPGGLYAFEIELIEDDGTGALFRIKPISWDRAQELFIKAPDEQCRKCKVKLAPVRGYAF